MCEPPRVEESIVIAPGPTDEHLSGHPHADESGQAGSTSPQQPSTPSDDGLLESLRGMAALATGRLALEDTLRHVAQFAVRAIPGADGAGLTLLERDRADTIVTTTPFVQEIDDIQYGLGEGPCISAAQEGTTMRSGSLGGDPRWPRFGARVARLHVHSVLSLPLAAPDGLVGAMNVYAHAKHAFGDDAAHIGELFAEPAAIAVQNAQVLADAKRLATHLQHLLESRAVIDQAVGIIMSRSGVGADEAFDRLRSISQRTHRKVRDIAQQLVDEARQRARDGS